MSQEIISSSGVTIGSLIFSAALPLPGSLPLLQDPYLSDLKLILIGLLGEHLLATISQRFVIRCKILVLLRHIQPSNHQVEMQISPRVVSREHDPGRMSPFPLSPPAVWMTLVRAEPRVPYPGT